MSKFPFSRISKTVCACTKGRLALTLTLALVALFATVGVLAQDYNSLPASNGAGEPKSFMMSLSSFPSMVMTRFFPQKSSQAKASISTDKKRYVAGEAVTITGAGFLPGEALTVQVKHADGSAEPGMGHEVFAATAGADGTFEATWYLHGNDSGKDFVAVAFGNSSGFSSTAQFSRIARVQTEKSGYGRGDTAVVTGSGFFPNEPVTLEVTQPDGSVQQQVVNADAAGSIASAVVVNSDPSPAGAMTLAATGVVSGLTAMTSSSLPVVTCPNNLNSCTAKDVRTTILAVGILNGDFCSSLTDTINLQITAEFKATSSERYDVGMFVSNDGGTVQEPSSANKCSGAAPQVGEGNSNAYTNDPDTDLFLNLESPAPDTCGDVSAIAGPVQWTFTTSVECNITNNQLIIPSCRVWDQKKDHNCTSLTQAGTGSKCDCTDLVVTTQLNPCATTICNDNDVCTNDSCVNVNNNTEARCVFTPGNAGTTCRDSAGQCDVADTCDGSHSSADGGCADVKASAGTACGDSSSGACDNADTCNASGVCQSNHVADGGSCGDAGTECTNQDTCLAGACHDNGFKPSTTTCTGTSNGGVCDGTDHCSGTANTCVDEYKPSTFTCRADGGACDVAETCTGSSGACPADGFEANSVTCTGNSNGGVCDGTDHCSGTANTCLDVYKASDVVCRADAGQCDVAENCTGSSGTCPTDGFAANTVGCTGTSQGGACDGADHCAGGINSCVDVFLPSTTICRADTGGCDVAESCTGSSGTCPADAFDTPPTVTLALNLLCENPNPGGPEQGGATPTQLVATVTPIGPTYSYYWTGPDGSPIVDGQGNPINAAAITPTKPGTYTVLVTDTATSCPNNAAFKLCFTGEQVAVASVAPTQQPQATASFTVPAKSQPTGFRSYLAKLLSAFG